jgi:hypothetical protein
MKNRGPENMMTLTQKEIAAAFSVPVWASRFPPILNVEQAAELASVPVKTVYDWSSRGLLSGCACRRGRRLLLWRDRYVQFLFHPSDN